MPDEPKSTPIDPNDRPAVFPMARLVSAMALAWLVAAALVSGAAALLGLDAPGVAMGAGSTLVGLVAGLLVLPLVTGTSPVAWAWAQVASSGVRMFVALGAGLTLQRSIGPDKLARWGALLVTALAALAAEVLVFLPAVKNGSMEAPA